MLLVWIMVIIVGVLWLAHGRGVPIFLYHEVQEDSGTTPLLLEQELAFLAKKRVNSFNMSSAKEWIEVKKKLPRNSVILTFDDGYADNYTHAYPLLKRFQMAATIYVNAGWIDRKKDYLSQAQIQAMGPLVDLQCHTLYHHRYFISCRLIGIVGVSGKLREGCDDIYGSAQEKGFPIFEQGGASTHRQTRIDPTFFTLFQTYYHEVLKTRPLQEMLELGQQFVNHHQRYFTDESEEEAMKRIQADYRENAEQLRKINGRKSEHFAWPWGLYSQRGKEALKQAGVWSIATCIRGTNSRKLSRFELRRNSIQNATLFKFKVRYFICKNLILGTIYEKLSVKNRAWEIKE